MLTAEELVEYIKAHRCSVNHIYVKLKIRRKFILDTIAEYEQRTGEKLPMPAATNRRVLYYEDVSKYMAANKCTQQEAAKHFKVAQASISRTLGKKEEASRSCLSPETTYSFPPLGNLWGSSPGQASA